MIKKLKIFFEPKKNRRKFKLQLTALTLSLILTGCNFAKNITKDNNHTIDNTITTSTTEGELEEENISEISVSSNSSIELSELSSNIISNEFLLSKEDNNYFQNYVNDIDVVYPMSDYFQVDIFLERYSNLEKYNCNISNKIIKENHINLDDLYNQVIKNNKKYLEDNSAILSKYEDTTDNFVKKICNVIVEYLNDYLKENVDKVDLNSLDIKLSELKIFDSTTFSYAYYNPDTGILGASSKVIESVKKTSQDDLAFEKIIEHETNHIIQASTIDELTTNNNYSMRFGPCYKFYDLKINCGYWDWFFESSAESLTSKYNNTNTSLTYQSDIESLETIKTATVLNSDNKVYGLEELSFQNDLEKIFNYFNCKSEKDKIEIIYLMYSFNIINEDTYTSSTNDFYKLYKEKNNESMDYTSRRILKSELSSSIGVTLSKRFYINLSNIIAQKEIKIGEIFQTISIFETKMSKLTKYYSNYNNEYTMEFIKNYSNIQYSFFEIIASSLNFSVEDLKNAYIEYNANFDIKELTVSYLSEEKINFYEYIIASNFNYKDTSIIAYNDCILKDKDTKS